MNNKNNSNNLSKNLNFYFDPDFSWVIDDSIEGTKDTKDFVNKDIEYDPEYLPNNKMKLGTKIFKLDSTTNDWDFVVDLSEQKQGDVCKNCSGVVGGVLIDACFCN